MKKSVLAFFFLAQTLISQGALHSEAVEYHDGATLLQGWLAYDDSLAGSRPAVLIVHQWKGLTGYEKKRAGMLAKLGYIAFAADIYGKGIRPETPNDAAAEAGKYKKDRPLLRARANAALEHLKTIKGVDPKKIAAIGYCFGGTTVIELARSGAPVAGVVSFHGGLDSPRPEDGRNIKCKVLAFHGADDPFVPPKDLDAFCDEMRQSKVDWQLVQYGGTVHSFTDWDAAKMNIKGAEYNKNADERSWRAMRDFFAEIFK